MKGVMKSLLREPSVAVSILLLAFHLMGCASNQTPIESETGGLSSEAAKAIVGIKIDEASEGTTVLIEGDADISKYTLVKQTTPLGVTLFFPDTDFKGIQPIQVGSSRLIEDITVREPQQTGHPTRVQILLKKDATYVPEDGHNAVKVVFADRIVAEPVAESAVPVETETAMVSMRESDIDTTGAPQTKMVEDTGAPAWVNRIHFASEQDGRSIVTIGTTRPVQHEMIRQADRKVQLKLHNTKIPGYQQRTIVTTRFESAVDRVSPLQSTGANAAIVFDLRESVPYRVEQIDDTLRVHFEASSVHPAAAELNAPAWQQAIEQGTLSSMAAAPASTSEQSIPAVAEPSTKAEDYMRQISDLEARRYTGEKIALDFFETDIKNVFRILKDVSGKNFAIDHGVTGKVTLTFDKPEPWDLVLDLILKMNKLGMVYEGDIIRIARLETIDAENRRRTALLEEERKSREQQRELEPMITEFIPVSYANARGEVLPHVTLLLTKDRGTASVDDRTSQIIVTDTADVLLKIKEIVRKIDKVTPQVLIEARIVEASTTFSKALGIQWGTSGGIQGTDPNAGIGPMRGFKSLGGTYGYNVAMNYPVAAGSSIGVNFTRIFGTPFMLDAQLMAMETMQEGKIISMPKILTLDNKPAEITQGRDYPYQERAADGFATTAFKEISLTLKVQPQVTPDNRILMKVNIDKNDLESLTSMGEPVINTKKAETELLVNNGDTIVIGGIIYANSLSVNAGLPILKDIPGIGWLFSGRQSDESKNELLIFITPSIVQLEQNN